VASLPHRCPTCRAAFPQAGFCPHDGRALVPDQAAATDDVSPTMVAPIRASAPQFGAAPSGMYQSYSAAENTAEALAAYHASAQARSEYDRLIGQTLDGRYLISKKLGEGGMGVVFAARHTVIERPLAIKVLKREVMRDAATIKRFVQEAKAASRIGHPNIIDVTDFGTTPDGMTYQVMEFVDGKTLGATIKATAPMRPSRVVRIASQLARALGAAHDKGIIHRDLKPENIFLTDRDGRRDFVKIVDFGIAKVTPIEGGDADGPRLTRAGAVFGTPEYMAPEQAAGRGDTDGRVDIYALGVIMYEMLTAKVPHKGDTMVKTLAMQMLDNPTPPRTLRPDLDIPEGLEDVVLRALSKKREQRYATMGQLLADLEAFAGTSLSEPVSPAASIGPDRAFTLAPLPPGADPVRVRSARPSMPLLDQRSRRGSDGLRPTGKQAAEVGPRTGDSGAHPIAAAMSTGDGASAPLRPSGAMPAATEASTPSPSVERRLARNEPRFVASGLRAVSLEPELGEDPLPPPPPRRWPWLLMAALMAGVLGVLVALTLRAPKATATLPVAVTEAVDARPGPPAPPDAAPMIPVPPDAGLPLDGRRRTTTVIPPRTDGGAAISVGSGGDGPLTPLDLSLPRGERGGVKITTVPDGGIVYTDGTYRGKSGVTIIKEPGTSAQVVCEMPGYEPGKVRVTWSKHYQELECPMKRVKCVEGLQNPFRDCP
jgi:serine/threonine protein kinase